MSRELAIGVMVAAAVLVLVLMLWGWRRRLRRDGVLIAPIGEADPATVRSRYEILYVATTRHDEPLERVAIRPLAYRARGEAVVTDTGVALILDGAPSVFLDRARLRAADRATWAIDRVVEPGGLARVVWQGDLVPQGDDGALLDSYLRMTSGDPQPFLTAVQDLCTPTETGASR